MKAEKLWNVVCTAAVADAFAMPLMSRPPYLIKADCGEGSLVRDLLAPLPDSPGHPFPRGSVTDVFSSSYALLRSTFDNGGLTPMVAEQAMFSWRDGADTRRYYDHFAGRSTRLRMGILDGSHVYDRFDKIPCEGRFITNGGAARAWVAGLLAPGNVEKAIDHAVTLTLPTHPNAISGSGAAVAAAMVSAALGGITSPARLFDVARQAVHTGYQKMEAVSHITAVGTKLPQRMELAANLAVRYANDEERLISEIHDSIGVGSYTSEVVPSALGFLIAADNDLEKALRLASNAGNNANKTAVIVCSVVAAATGSPCLTEKYFDIVSENNTLDFKVLKRAFDRYFDPGR